ncbi:T9SS C-terminal target domain-containing protein, partial [Saprospiraceae bacterium]|nr:T9SS C-terminal target domain-containing protein [Saprospiraceae bacterium]
MIDDIFYLVGGHKFMGRYNPMGPDHGPGFEQEYTNEIRKFSIDFYGPLSVEIQDVIHDEMNLHRRDYNLVPYLSDDERELMIYSGV